MENSSEITVGSQIEHEVTIAGCAPVTEVMAEVVAKIKVTMNQNQTPQEALNATERLQIVDDSIIAGMPRTVGKATVTVYFFRATCPLYDHQVADAFEKFNLTPVDPMTLAAFNEANPTFADDRPNATIWMNTGGEWRFLLFEKNNGEKTLEVQRCTNNSSWLSCVLFAGIRKS